MSMPNSVASHKAFGADYRRLCVFLVFLLQLVWVSPASAAGWRGASSLNIARDRHSATLLPNGKVLVAGGFGNSGGTLASAELYDPATNTWSAAGNLVTARDHHSATLLPNGKLLVAGGIYGLSSYPWPAPSSMTRPPIPGRQPAAWPLQGIFTAPRSCPMARSSSRGGPRAAASSPAPSSMTRPPTPGRPPATWPPQGIDTAPRFCPMARSSSRGGTTVTALWSASNSMTRPPTAGRPPLACPL
ncbi:MAG: hypothetical protein IPN53_16185 [Comamonadaceae bacterium]|nr:hypothetical protein [Comamonadaceae bacterium]